ncbi:MAG: hypothetical protein LH632_11755, partial [Rhodoferax sp.]|nr:hypothetical protein [Rhodoferax sp.]
MAMNYDSTIPSRLDPMNTVPAPLVAVLRETRGSDEQPQNLAGKLVVTAAVVVALLALARYVAS